MERVSDKVSVVLFLMVLLGAPLLYILISGTGL